VPVDAPPPAIVAVPVVPESVAAAGPVYGPVDTEARSETGRAQSDCPQPTADEIVVCAEVDNDQYRLGRIEPPATARNGLNEALNFRIGNLELGSIDKGDGTRVFGLRLKF